MSDMRLILVGGGAFGRELINWVRDAQDAGQLPPWGGFLDHSAQALSAFRYDLAYRGTTEDFQPQPHERLVMAVGDPLAKQELAHRLRARGGLFAQVVHPSAVVARSARLGEGVVICPQALVSADAEVGDFVAINAASSVGHDVVVGECSTLSAHVDLTGRVQVGPCCFFGSGARVLPGVRLGERARIGAGCVVMRHVPAGAVMYTPPAKRL